VWQAKNGNVQKWQKGFLAETPLKPPSSVLFANLPLGPKIEIEAEKQRQRDRGFGIGVPGKRAQHKHQGNTIKIFTIVVAQVRLCGVKGLRVERGLTGVKRR